MLELLLYTIMFSVFGYALLAVSGVLGNAGILIVGLVLPAAVLAGLLVSYQNTSRRLARMEEKLDKLLAAQKEELPPEGE